MSQTQTPTVGRIVLVPMDPRTNNGCDHAAAIITQAWSATTVNLRVIGDGQPSDADWRTSVTYANSLADLPRDDPNQLHRWTWPPRV